MPTRSLGSQPDGLRASDTPHSSGGFAFYFFMGALLLGVLGLIGYAVTL